MIIWINGGFGSGKTHAAYELEKRLENAYVFDPEETGFFIRKNIPRSLLKSDFQDYVPFRSLSNYMLNYISEGFDGVLIVPMTVTDKTYYKELTENLDVNHVTLVASPETLSKRLLKRKDKKGSWAFHQIERCVKAFEDDAFKEHINTDHLTIDEVVETIASINNLQLKEDTRSVLKKKWDRRKIWMHHKGWI